MKGREKTKYDMEGYGEARKQRIGLGGGGGGGDTQGQEDMEVGCGILVQSKVTSPLVKGEHST